MSGDTLGWFVLGSFFGLIAFAVWMGENDGPLQRTPARRRVTWATIIAIGLAGVVAYNLSGPSTLVSRYCYYGAVSEAQLNGCLENVTEGSIGARRTNAARFARDEDMACGSDSGPFCEPD